MRRHMLGVVVLIGAVTTSCSDGTSSDIATTARSTSSTAVPTSTATPTSLPTTVPTTAPPVTSTTTPEVSPVLPASLSFNLPDGFMYPEGAAFDPATGRVYVTSVQSGAIAVAEPGSDTATVWLPAGGDGRAMPTLGIEFGDGRVWIASMGALYEYRTDGTLIARHDPTASKGGGLNDVAVTGDGVYVSDSYAPLVWYLPLDAPADTPLQRIDIGAVNPLAGSFNGIEALPDGTLVVGAFIGSQLFHVDPRVPSAVTIDLGEGPYAGTDGMSLDGNVLWTTNTYGNAVDRITLCPSYDCGTVIPGKADALLSFPTDVQVAGDRVLVVNAQMLQGLLGPGEPTLPFTVAAIPVN